MAERDYQEEARTWMVWYVTWEDAIPEAARKDLERRLERLSQPAPMEKQNG